MSQTISFVIAFTALECMKRYWETICGEESLFSWSDLPPDSLSPHGLNWAHKIADFFLFVLYLVYYCLNGFHIWGVYIGSGLPPDPLLWVKLWA